MNPDLVGGADGGLTPVSSVTTTGFNLSLFKVGPILHVAIGATVASLVLIATTITVIVVAARSKYDPPVLVDDKETTFKTTPKDMFVLKNDQDPKGGNLTITAVTQPLYGKVEIQSNGGHLRYTPANIGKYGPHFAGTVSFKYQAKNDKLTEWANATVIVLNHAPEAVSITYTLSKNSVNNVINVFADKDATGKQTFDLDTDELTVSEVTQPAQGQAVISADKKTVLYTPVKNFKSADSFDYTITDLNDTSVATINVIIQNDAPKAAPDFYRGQKNMILPGLTLLANDIDVNGDVLSILSIRNTGIGQGFINPDGVTAEYWPIKGQYGDSFEYTCTDGDLTSSSYVSVTMFNTPPTAGTYSVTIGKGTIKAVVPFLYGDPDSFETLTVTLGTGAKAPVGLAELSVVPETVVDPFLPGSNRFIQWTKNTWTMLFTPKADQQYYTDSFSYFVSDGNMVTEGRITVNVENLAPVPTPDFATVGRNSAAGVVINVLLNDTDPNGDPLDLVLPASFVTARGGLVSKVGSYPTSQLKYIPAQGVFGEDSFTYTVTDVISAPNTGLQKIATGTVNILIANTAPVAQADFFTVPRGNSLSLNILLNDTDADGDALSIANLPSTSVSGVSLVVANNKVTYAALSGAPYVDSFTYQASDSDLLSNLVTVTIDVVNSAPVATNDFASIHWNNSVAIPIIANDLDINPTDVPVLIAELKTTAKNGIALLSANGQSLTYTPARGFVGTDYIQYVAVDPFGAKSSWAWVNITVTNGAPTAVADSYSLHWGNTLVMDVLLNDRDDDGDAIALISTTSAKAVISNGVIIYTATNTQGVETFQYTITDYNKESTATVTVTVENAAPAPIDDTLSIHWASAGVIVNVLANDVDSDNDPLTVSNVYGVDASFGSATIVGGETIQYVPSRTKKGTTSFIYTVTDTVAPRNATVHVTITDATVPTAIAKSFTTHWRTPQTRIDVVSSATDADGDALTVSLVTFPSSPSTASLQVDPLTGLQYIQYMQNSATFTGPISWNYKVSDGLASVDAMGLISGNIYNTPPTGKSYTGIYLPFVLATTSGITINVINDATDADAVDIPFLVIGNYSTPSSGTLTMSDDKKSFTFVATTNGTVTFTYKVFDGQANSVDYTISVETGLATLGSADKFYTVHWRNVTGPNGKEFNVTGNPDVRDDGVNHLFVYLNGVLLSNPAHGTASTGTPRIIDRVDAHPYDSKYVANPGYLGTDSYIVQTTDGTALSQISVTILITNAKPVASAISKTVHWSSSAINIDLMSATSDPNGDPRTITSTTFTPTCGSAVWNPTLYVAQYTPSATLGTCTFTYTVSDGIESTSGTVSVLVTNLAPIPSPKYGEVHWSVHKTGYTINNLLLGDVDPDGDIVTLVSVGPTVSPASGGTVLKTGASAATLTATVGSTFVNNNVTFNYVITDGPSESVGTVNLKVYDTAPVGFPDTYTVNGTFQQSTFTFNVLVNDKDADQAKGFDTTLFIQSVSYTGSSIVSIVNGMIQYIPPQYFVGTETFTYIVTDGLLDGAAIQVTVNVQNQAPIPSALSYTVMWNQNVLTSPLTGATDPEMNLPLALVGIVSAPASGTTLVNGDTVLYTPSVGIVYTGTSGSYRIAVDTFQYRIKDSYQRTAIGTITITVKNTPPVAVADNYSLSKTTANPVQIFPVLVNDVDADGNTIRVASVSTSVKGATITTNGTHIFYLPPAGLRQTTDTFTYIINDGQLDSAPATVSVTITNAAPTCGNFAQTVNKMQYYQFNLNTLANPQDPNGDAVTWSLSGSNVYTLATVNISSSTVGFISLPRRSGIQVFSYIVTDGLSSATCQATITIQNRAPTAVPDLFNFRKDPGTVTFNPTTNDYDVDSGDGVSMSAFDGSDFTIKKGGTLSRSGNVMTFVVNATFAAPPTLRMYYTITDDDQDFPMNATGYTDVNVNNYLPTVVPDTISVAYGSVATVLITQLMANDLNAQGVTDPTLQFAGLVSCSTLAPLFYCLGAPPVLNAPSTGYISIPWSGRCTQNQIQYCINIAGDLTAQACGIVTVTYTDCTCNGPVDLVYVLQLSSATQNQVNIVNFIQNTINRFSNSVKDTGINIGGVLFGTTGQEFFPLGGDPKVVTSQMSDFKKLPAVGDTNIIAGMTKAIEVAGQSKRPGTPVVYVLLSDGLPTAPCGCMNCTCTTCGTGGTPKNVTGTCTPYNPTNGGHFCLPCASAESITNQLNDFWLTGNTARAGTKVISYGFGDNQFLWNNQGWNMVKRMNFNPTKSLSNPWNDLQVAVPQLVDAICNVY